MITDFIEQLVSSLFNLASQRSSLLRMTSADAFNLIGTVNGKSINFIVELFLTLRTTERFNYINITFDRKL